MRPNQITLTFGENNTMKQVKIRNQRKKKFIFENPPFGEHAFYCMSENNLPSVNKSIEVTVERRNTTLVLFSGSSTRRLKQAKHNGPHSRLNMMRLGCMHHGGALPIDGGQGGTVGEDLL